MSPKAYSDQWRYSPDDQISGSGNGSGGRQVRDNGSGLQAITHLDPSACATMRSGSARNLVDPSPSCAKHDRKSNPGVGACGAE